MTIPSNEQGGGCGQWPHSTPALDHRLSRRQARRMSRRFAGVGVGIAAARLREISAGAPAAESELTDVEFAFVAGEFMDDERHAKHKRGKQRFTSWFVVAAMTLVVLGSLLCTVVLLLSLMLRTSPI
ncbi:hypothetical protein FR943_02015 [Mycobacterium sp. TNTM28]|uniref:DUF3040 domain-containing protein n=1 Tax=[Mycobacterium] fortunisiensis TaxID=2600579 RepID=A0ABS6KGC5_9MYCO|nr:hypothetical protein [[Mycobacterium] fortunisiensis]MBU9762629.1 hypothetical protein [[Mycobacterium] fortunisiensis]